MALTLDNLRLTPAPNSAATGSALFNVLGTGTFDVTVSVPNAPTALLVLRTQTPPLLNIAVPALPPGTYQIGLLPFDTGVLASTTFTIPVAPPPITLATPPALVAAHLPVLLALQATPTGNPAQAAALVVVVEVYRAGAWQSAGLLREVCDATGRAEFYLNEYLKTQFSPTPPDESGAGDPALAIQYRARYARAPFDGTAGAEAGTVTGLAVNAALPVNPTAAALPLGLGPAMPYSSVPATYARFQSIVLPYASGVANVPTVAVNSSAWPCPVRQFVWLHASGAWCWGLFSGRHEHGAETGDDVTVRRADGDYYVGGGDTRETLRVYSDKLDWPTFQVLSTIRRARRVYERLSSGQYLPVLLERGAFVDYKETDKTFEVNFTARYPVQVVQTF